MGKKIQCIGRYVMDGQTLGKGTFGKVELATHSLTACKVAIKIIDTRKIKEEYVQQNLHREARILGQLRHPNIVRLYETLKATTLYCLVLECAAGGDLLAYIKTHKESCLSEDKSRVYMRQLVSAVHYLHERGVAHRDLKMENIMLDEKKRNIKLVDFGLSNTFTKDDLMKTHCGSLEYAAPELFIMSEPYGPQIDIWALGVIMYAMLVGRLPFTTAYTDQYRRQKLQQQVQKGLIESHEKEMCHLTKDCKNLLKKLLEPDCDLRLPLMDLEIHPWVTHGSKSPFHTFHKFPKDKGMKIQVIEDLSSIMQMKKEEVEAAVHESKCDELSAMYNMMMDSKREEKGIFNIDYTVDQIVPEKKPKKKKKSHHHHHKREKEKAEEQKALEASKASVDDGHEEEHRHEHKVSTAFDFMAICSAPTWLGQERRRSRRRKSYFPQPSPLAMNNPEASSEDVAGNAVGGDNPHLLSIHPGNVTPGNTTPFNRRSLRSSRRRKRPSSCGPSNRRSLREKVDNHKGNSSSQPSSPTTLISPIITVDPPNQNVPRPHKLDVPDCYGSVTLQVPERTVSFSNMDDSCSYLDSQYSDSSNPGSAISYTPNSLDTNSASANGSKPDWAMEGAYELDSSENRTLPEIQIPLKKPLRRIARQDSVEARIASADIKSIVRPKQLSAMQNQSHQKNHMIPHYEHVVQKEESFGMRLRATPKISDKLLLPNSDIHANPEVKVLFGENQTCSPICNNVENKTVVSNTDIGKGENIETVCSKHENSKQSTSIDNNVETNQISGTQLLDIATGGFEPAKSSMQCDERGKNNGDYNSDSSQELSGDELNQSITHLETSVKQIVLNDSNQENVGSISLSVNGKYTPEHNCDLSNVKLNSVDSKHAVKSNHEEICKPYVVDLGVPFSRTNSPKYIETNLDAPDNAAVSCTPSDHKKGSRNSLPCFIMPSTPTREQFTSPIARIDSFHSEDFDAVDNDLRIVCQSNSTTPGSVNTPTIPCFAYKLQLHKRKNAKLKHSKFKEDNQSCNKEEKTVEDKNSRNETNCTDPLIGSGSDKSISDESSDKPQHCSKAKIHPMDKDDMDSTKNCKPLTKTKCSEDPNCLDVTGKKQQNTLIKPCNSQPPENKKTCVKYSPWKHGLVQFLKKKKQGQIRHGSQNNNDSFRSNNHTIFNSTGRNGHARCSYKALSTTDDGGVEAETQFQKNSIAVRPDTLEIRPCPVPGLSPGPAATKMFDLTVLSADSPQANSCLLSWKGCRDCTIGNVPSDEEESTFRFEQSVDVAIKTNMTIQNSQDAKTYTAYKYSHS